MPIKNIQIDEQLHRQVKLAATLYNMTIREFTERALRKVVLPDLKTLVDTKAEYITEGEDK